MKFFFISYFPLKIFFSSTDDRTSVPGGTLLLVLFLLIVSDLFSIITNTEKDF